MKAVEKEGKFVFERIRPVSDFFKGSSTFKIQKRKMGHKRIAGRLETGSGATRAILHPAGESVEEIRKHHGKTMAKYREWAFRRRIRHSYGIKLPFGITV
jgi:hypothetical protein